MNVFQHGNPSQGNKMLKEIQRRLEVQTCFGNWEHRTNYAEHQIGTVWVMTFLPNELVKEQIFD